MSDNNHPKLTGIVITCFNMPCLEATGILDSHAFTIQFTPEQIAQIERMKMGSTTTSVSLLYEEIKPKGGNP